MLDKLMAEVNRHIAAHTVGAVSVEDPEVTAAVDAAMGVGEKEFLAMTEPERERIGAAWADLVRLDTPAARFAIMKGAEQAVRFYLYNSPELGAFLADLAYPDEGRGGA